MRDQLLILTGRDGPGALARILRALADQGASLLDVEEVVVHGFATFALLVGADDEALKAVRRIAAEVGLQLDVRAPPSVPAARGDCWAVTLIGRSLGAGELAAIAEALGAYGVAIERVARLSPAGMESLEMAVRLPPSGDAAAVKAALLRAAGGSFDVAFQRETLLRRAKRLVVLDMDSTLIRIEVIDELARAHGVHEQVAAITSRAMHGELDYDQSLRERVALLKGLPARVLFDLAANLPLTEGAETLVRALKRLGYRTGILSGGFSVAAQALQLRLGIDFAASNELELADGLLTGRVVEPIVNAQRKADLLGEFAAREGIPLDQVIAVGDGANDLLMLQKAGHGIAFRAKPRLREAADSAISAGGLDAILYLLGLHGRDIAALLAG